MADGPVCALRMAQLGSLVRTRPAERGTMNLPGATVIVTGASSGIGRETALEFARRGANVVVAARREDRLHEVAAKIRRIGVDALVVPCDVSRREDIEGLVPATLDRCGRIYVLAHNAG